MEYWEIEMKPDTWVHYKEFTVPTENAVDALGYRSSWSEIAQFCKAGKMTLWQNIEKSLAKE